jgi:hypothetical protein
MKIELLSKVETSAKFKEVLEQKTFRNLTGGCMALEFTDQDELIVYGCNLPLCVEANSLYIDGVKVVDFSKEIISMIS